MFSKLKKYKQSEKINTFKLYFDKKKFKPSTKH